MSRGKKFPGCRECNHLARHPWCPLCPKKMHWVGGLTRDENGIDTLDRSAPSRRVEHRVTLAYLLPFMVEGGQLPAADLNRVTTQVLGDLAAKVIDSKVYGFEWGKHPYKFKVLEADLSGTGMPFAKVRYGGWSCREHKGATPADLPALALEREEYTCVVCGREKDLEVVYLCDVEEKGSASLGNMTVFCRYCKEERGDKNYWAFIRSKGMPINDLIVDFKTSYVRSVNSKGKVLL